MGVNLLTPPKKDPLWKQFLEKFSDPLIVILIIAGILSIGIACYEYFGLGEGLTVFFEQLVFCMLYCWQQVWHSILSLRQTRLLTY